MCAESRIAAAFGECQRRALERDGAARCRRIESAERVPDRDGARSARRILAGIAGAVLLTLFGGFAEWMWPQRFASMTFVSFGLGLFVALSFPIIMMLGRFQRVLARVAETMSIAETGSS